MVNRTATPRRVLLKARLPAGLAVALLTLAVAGCGSRKSPAISLFGPFAGYTWHGKVRQVSALLVVPELKGCHGHEFAGTWIGAQGRVNPETQAARFFQVGVNEECTPPPRDGFYAFWSSDAQQFHPQWLFDVRPGDTVHLAMRRDGGRWLMTARDRSMGEQQSVALNLARGARLGAATWHQEDVTNGDTSNPYPYPKVGVVRFSALQVDGRAPRAAALTTIWMSAGHSIYGPTPLVADAFSIGPIRPSTDALHYQRIAIRQDLAAYLFNAKLASWTPATASSDVKPAVARFLRAMQQSIAGLRSYPWPARASGGIERLVAANLTLRDLLRRVLAGHASYVQVRSLLGQDAISNAGLTVRKQLHMGITDLSLISVNAYIKAHSG